MLYLYPTAYSTSWYLFFEVLARNSFNTTTYGRKYLTPTHPLVSMCVYGLTANQGRQSLFDLSTTHNLNLFWRVWLRLIFISSFCLTFSSFSEWEITLFYQEMFGQTLIEKALCFDFELNVSLRAKWFNKRLDFHFPLQNALLHTSRDFDEKGFKIECS